MKLGLVVYVAQAIEELFNSPIKMKEQEMRYLQYPDESRDNR